MLDSKRLKKPALFRKSSEWLLFFGVVFLLFWLQVTWEYHSYKEFISKPFFYTWAKVLRVIPKESSKGNYKIVKLRTEDGLILYTYSHRKDLNFDTLVRIQLFPSNKITFLDYTRGSYILSRIVEVKKSKENLKDILRDAINKQHKDSNASNFYRAIFLADPLIPSLRERIDILGIAPLVALSGFHLGILWGVVFWILKLIYRPFQKRFFPWRYDFIDIGIVSLFILFGYLLLTGSPPSLLRSYCMLLFGWIAIIFGIELFSFSFLLIVTGVLLIFKADLILSIGFILSVAGVFYIFLILKYFKDYTRSYLFFIILSFGIFILMQPITHTIFPTLSPLQFLSPLLSILFIPFYPIEIILHYLGLGDTFDGLLKLIWNFKLGDNIDKLLPTWVLLVYITLSILAVYFRFIFIMLFIFSGATLLWLYLG